MLGRLNDCRLGWSEARCSRHLRLIDSGLRRIASDARSGHLPPALAAKPRGWRQRRRFGTKTGSAS